MVKLNTINNRHKLREVDALMPGYQSAIRWSSTSAMVDRYFHIYDKMNRLDDGLTDFTPPPPVNVHLRALHDDIKNLESANKKLQTSTVSLLIVRVLFDHMVKHYPSTSTQLSATSGQVKFPDFENGAVKLLAGKVRTLSRTEKAAVPSSWAVLGNLKKRREVMLPRRKYLLLRQPSLVKHPVPQLSI
ncbi:hypothetical protein PC128_g24490 [Phytophthora cactorum]|nr:hypothetical protein PC128_g24490 [Phytophthora cactorum]